MSKTSNPPYVSKNVHPGIEAGVGARGHNGYNLEEPQILNNMHTFGETYNCIQEYKQEMKNQGM